MPRQPPDVPRHPPDMPHHPPDMPRHPPSDPREQPPGTPDVLDEIARWREAGRGVALATVIATWGSSPRPAGSLLGVDDAGHMVGSVSGGCVEGSVVETALAVIASGRPEILDFGVTDEMAWEVGLACGGEMQVYVDRVAAPGESSGQAGAWLDGLLQDRADKRPVALVVDLASGRRERLHPGPGDAPDASADADVAASAREALRSDLARLLDHDPVPLFVQPFNPPLRLVVVGAVHIAQPLCRMASEIGYAVTIVDPRRAFANADRFPGVDLLHDWPDDALRALALDARTAVVTLTHDPKLDDPALAVALRSPAFYVGSLGSQRTQARRLERLAALGLSEAESARLHGPVGLAIGARSPAEIAVSILAEITARLRERSA